MSSGLDDGDYVLAGYSARTNRAEYADVSGVSGLDVRSKRNWFVDVTDPGGDLTVNVVFDLSDMGLTAKAGAAGNYVLLTRSGTSGNWTAVQSGATSVSGDEISFEGISFTDGNSYTIGTTAPVESPLISGHGRTVAGNSGADQTDEGWRMLGVPVTGPAVAEDLQPPISTDGNYFITFNLNSGKQSYTWDDTNSQWIGGTKTTAFPEGRGFILFLFDDKQYPLDKDIPLDVEVNGGTPGDSSITVGDATPSSDEALETKATWHLLSNPYETSFDLSGLNLSKDAESDGADFQATVQVWDPSEGSYTGISQAGDDSDVIAPWQGFFVERADSSSGAATSLTFSNTGRTTGGSLIGSKIQRRTNYREMGLRLVAKDADGTELARDDAASLYFHSRAGMGWDFYDATKLKPFSESYVTVAPLGQAGDGTQKLKAQESRAYVPDTLVQVPLDVQIADLDPSQLTLSAPEWKNIPAEWTVRLVDTKGSVDPADNDTVAFGSESSYTFTETESTTKARSKETGEKAASKKSRGSPLSVSPLRRRDVGTGQSTQTAKASADTTRFILRIERDSEQPQPVEVDHLSARTKGTSVLLEWATASETNNAGFYVEHQRLASGDGSASIQSADWTRRGFVEGRESSNSSQEYSLRISDIDYGRHAFRLRQVDENGSTTYSRVVKTDVRLQKGHAVIGPYPNPSHRQANLEVTVRKTQPVRIDLYDMLGRRIRTVYKEELSGQQTRHVRIRTHQLASGMYFLRVEGEDFTLNRRMTIVK